MNLTDAQLAALTAKELLYTVKDGELRRESE